MLPQSEYLRRYSMVILTPIQIYCLHSGMLVAIVLHRDRLGVCGLCYCLPKWRIWKLGHFLAHYWCSGFVCCFGVPWYTRFLLRCIHNLLHSCRHFNYSDFRLLSSDHIHFDVILSYILLVVVDSQRHT